jgi:hypothetical protein
MLFTVPAKEQGHYLWQKGSQHYKWWPKKIPDIFIKFRFSKKEFN